MVGRSLDQTYASVMVRRPELEDPELEPPLNEEVVGWVQAEEEVALEDQLSAVVLSDQSLEDEITFEQCQSCQRKGGPNVPGGPKLAHCSKWPRREWRRHRRRKKRSHQTRRCWKMWARRKKKTTESGRQQRRMKKMWSMRNREPGRFGRAS